MKKALCVLLVLLMMPAAALADADLAAMSVDDLRQLRDAVNLELAARCQAGDALASWDSTLAHVDLVSIRIGLTEKGEKAVALVFAYTNTSAEIDNFRAHHWITVYHDGVECDRAIFLDGELVGNDSWGKKVQPGSTLKEMQWFFVLSGESKTIDIEIEDRTTYQTKIAGIITISLPD